MTRALACLLLAAGCGRLGFGAAESSDASRDVSTLDDSTPPSDGTTFDAKPCTGTTHTVTENFDDNVYNAALWGNAYNDTKTTYAETGGRLVFTLGMSSSNDWAGYVSTTGYQLANDRLFVEVPQISASGTNTMLMAAVALTFNDGPSIESEVGRIKFRKRVGGAIMDLADLPYDSVAHRWWQIRETAGRTYWELSADGVNWITWYQENSAPSTNAFITLVAGTNSSLASPGTAIFDNLNGGAAPPNCP